LTDQTDTIDQELDEECDGAGDEEEWEALEREELPPRPRNRFLRPLPISLLAVLIAALGFLGGVEVQKGSGEGASASSPFGGGLPSLQGAPFAAASGGGAGGGEGEAITGTVTGVNGKTVYVKDPEGTVHAVRAAAGATVTRTAKAEAKGIHPGDSVVVEGTQNGSKVTATSIRATAGGVEAAGPGAAGGGESSGGEEGGVASLFAE
jgi:hypothetical protein